MDSQISGLSSLPRVANLLAFSNAILDSSAGADIVRTASWTGVTYCAPLLPRRHQLRQVLVILLSAVLGPLLATSAGWAKVIHVPGDQPTIQAGINAASNGDTVQVSRGVYLENINFNGKLIAVVSKGGRRVTVIDGNLAGPVVTFSSGERRAAMLSGFTITHGLAAGSGGGIAIANSSPTITDNLIVGNAACGGGGIAVSTGPPFIWKNAIRQNHQMGCSGGNGGGGILVVGNGTAEILSNAINANSMTSANGGGIAVLTGGQAAIVQNVIVNNHAGQGGGVFIGAPAGASGPIVVNNTVAFNSGTQMDGSALWTGGFDAGAQFINNLLIGTAGQNAVFCDAGSTSTSPIFHNNDALSAGAIAFKGSCAGQVGQSGNISQPPAFANDPSHGVFGLLAGSPAIDAGLNSAPHLPSVGFGGLPRIVDGNGDHVPTVDMGALEFQPVIVIPRFLALGTHRVGSHLGLNVTLTNHQNVALAVTRITAGGDFSATNDCPASLAAGATCTIKVDFAPTAGGARTATLTVNDDDTNGPRAVPLSGAGGTPAAVAKVFCPGKWQKVATSGPPGRYAHAMSYDVSRQRTVLFGGNNASGGRLGDTWEWNGNSWTGPATSSPGPLTYSALAYDSKRHVVMLFGGTAPPFTDTNDTWKMGWD